MSYCNNPGVRTALYLSLLAATTVSAQTPPAEQIEEVLVTGTNLSRQKALQIKRDSDRLVDAIGTDELGQLPDKNIGESLNRLPGVSMLVEKGEGRFIQIRGIQPSLNNVTMNGLGLGSPEADDGGRLAPMDLISGSLLGSVEVIKTPTADMDAQGIGGTVNIDTKMPFDNEEDFYGYATARYGWEEFDPESEAYGGEDPYSIDVLLSGKNADHTLGWLLGGAYSSREYIGHGIYQDDWMDVSDTTLPEEVKNNYYVIGRERVNLSAVLEYKPSDDASYFVRAFWADWDEFQHRNRYQQALTRDIVAQSPSAGRSGPDRVSANVRLEEVTKEIFTVAVGGENRFGDLTLDYTLQANRNELDEPYSYWEFRSGRDFGPNSWRVSGDGVVEITPDAGTPDRQDPNLIDFRRVRFQDRSMEEDGLIAEANLRWDFSNDTYYKFGAKMTETERENDYNRRRYDGGVRDLNLGSDPSFTSGAFTHDTDAGDAPNIWLNVDAMNAFFADPANADFFEFNDGDTFAQNFSNDYKLTETIWAAYGMGVWENGPWQVIGGLRAEFTDIESQGFVMLPDESAEVVKGDDDYVTLLPSLIVNYQLREDVILRSAITRALGRADYDVIAPRSSYEEEAAQGELVIGNPGLEPRESWNFDMAIEWYPNEMSLLALSVFYKDIDNEFIERNTSYTDQAAMDAALDDLGLAGTIDTSILEELTVTTTENGDSSDLLGVEINAQTQFAQLPAPFNGLGAAVSASFIDAEVEVERDGEAVDMPLPGQAETTYSLSLFYQTQSVDMALSYTYNDSFLTDINDSPAEDLDQGEFGRWDFKASWVARENLKLFFEAVNLNNEPTTEFQGGRTRQNTEHEYVGRTLYLGVSYGF